MSLVQTASMVSVFMVTLGLRGRLAPKVSKESRANLVSVVLEGRRGRGLAAQLGQQDRKDQPVSFHLTALSSRKRATSTSSRCRLTAKGLPLYRLWEIERVFRITPLCQS